MTSESFKEEYKKLNAEQKKAVDAIEGAVMVIAGPGTGKTQILTLRIANILLKTDTASEQILAITFTESGVSAMRKRLRSIIGDSANRVNIFTFHGFCKNVIERFPEYFGRIIGRSVASEVDKICMFERALDSTNFEFIRPFNDPYYYLKAIASNIKDLKRENIDPEKFIEMVAKEERDFENIPDKIHEKGKYKGSMKGVFQDKKRHIEKNKELASVFVLYEKYLAEEKKYDFEDMIMETVRVLSKSEDLLLMLQEEYQYILADEHQDANGAQNNLLELLSNFHENPNLFVVGDEKQAIFRFQGASLENFLYFKRVYPEALLIELTDNYRSNQTILDASHSLIEHGSVNLPRKKLLSKNGTKDKKPITIIECQTPFTENKTLVDNISKLLEAGVNPNEVAVLYRNNKDAFSIADLLSKFGILSRIESDQDLLHDSDILKLLLLLKAIADPTNDTNFAEVLFVDVFGLPLLDIYKVLELRGGKHKKIIEIISNEEILRNGKIEEIDKFLLFGRRLLGFANAAKNKPLPECFEEVVRESGFLEHCLALPNSLDVLHKLDSFFNVMREVSESNPKAKLVDFLSHIETLENYKMSLVGKSVGVEEGAVRLMTAHRSKGLEFEYVFIVGATRSHFDKKSVRNLFHLPGEVFEENEIDDERRLFYVALTRAKIKVTISYSSTREDGKEEEKSQFIDEIDDDLKENNFAEKISVEEVIENKIKPKKLNGLSIKEKTYIVDRFFEQGLAVTALNNYLECPWKYFFVNLLRLPQQPTLAQYFGTAIHEALRFAVVRKSVGDNVSEEDVFDVFVKTLDTQPLGDNEYKDALKRGREAIMGYFRAFSDTWSKGSQPEVSINGVSFEFKKGGEPILLKGKLDRMDVSDNGRDVSVYDYKTSKPKSRNQILGDTKNASGNEYRQLVFYRLLVERYFEDRYKMKEGIISFVEADDKGRFHEERFEILDDHLMRLEETITNFAKDITEFSFWDKTCDEKDCEFCKLSRVIK
jgi:DNA helicase-2/ATP-dependent DNA helicase PcrA